MDYVGSWEGAHHLSTERDLPSKWTDFDFPGEPKAVQEFSVCACTALRTADLLFSSFTVDTRHSLYSALSFLFLSLGINIKVKEIYRVCLKEHKSFCNLPYSLALK